ncbi:hypothetical protein [Oceanobacillus sp. Castelsardo]|uniref:hypothetical protein n=1 Tax=Oceanobacillus sp. Castelsardo TaxID=1851204 RepID=UPI0008395211|nr:hypothetical protein [Oceanobacillus sp. Castelsardo]
MKLQNEQGIALIYSLFIITLISIFILGLFTQITNTTRQVSTMEQQMDAQLVAEMGITYFQKKIEGHQEELQMIANDNSNNLGSLEDEIIDIINKSELKIPVDGQQRWFEIELKENPKYDEDNNEITIKFTSKSGGKAYRKSKSVDGQIVLQLQSESEE